MGYRKILAPFDGSRLAQAALSVGAWLAWRGGGELDVVTAVPHVGSPFPFKTQPLLDTEPDEATKLARTKTELSAQVASLGKSGVNATVAAVRGDPQVVLLEYIKRHGIQLVVMGTRGRSLPERFLLGSVASKIAQRSPVPVLLVPREMRPIHDDALRVLVALDESSGAQRGLEAALDLADTVPADIMLFEVLSGAAADSDRRTLGWYEEPVIGASNYLDNVRKRLAEQGVGVRRAYSVGRPADEILLFADAGQFDVVAVGTRGLTGIPRLVWGSVAEEVVRHARVPILVAPPSMSPVEQSRLVKLEMIGRQVVAEAGGEPSGPRRLE